MSNKELSACASHPDIRYLAQFNLNCLVVFATIYIERNITRTSEVLGISQPAVSNSLCKLRTQFNDRLFYPRDRQMVPTVTAHEIAKTLLPLLGDFQNLLNRFTED